MVLGRKSWEKVRETGVWPYVGKGVFVLSETLDVGIDFEGVRVVRSVDEVCEYFVSHL